MLKALLANSTSMIAAAFVGVAAVGFVAWRAATALPPVVAPPHEATRQGPVSALNGKETPKVPPAAKIELPEFDIVRVEPSGETVVAGRAPPQSVVALYDGDKKVTDIRSDPNGQFVMLPPALAPGDHQLTLRSSGAQGETASEQSVTVAVAAKPGEKTIAALTAPDRPTVLLGEPPKSRAASVDSPQIAVRTAEAGAEGAFFASGVAAPEARVRLYLNGSVIADVQATKDGQWALRVERGMMPGHYDVRADMVEPANGKVIARAEVPFDYPVRVAAGPAAQQGQGLGMTPPVQVSGLPRSSATAPAVAEAPRVETSGAPRQATTGTAIAAAPQVEASGLSRPSASAPASVATPSVTTGAPAQRQASRGQAPLAPALVTRPQVTAGEPPRPVDPLRAADAVATSAGPVAAAIPGLAIVSDIQSVTVIRGDSLWRISRNVLGRGARYTQIYEANATQIRDPNRIWPGQILVAPKL